MRSSAQRQKHSRSGSHDMAMVERTLELSGRDQSRCMGHVAHKEGLLAIGNLPQVFIIPIPWVGRSTADDQTWLEDLCRLLKLWVVDQMGGAVERVGQGLEVDGRCGDLLLRGVVAMREMSTVGKTKAHQTVLRLDQGRQGGKAVCRDSACGPLASTNAGTLTWRSVNKVRRTKGAQKDGTYATRVRLNVDAPDLSTKR